MIIDAKKIARKIFSKLNSKFYGFFLQFTNQRKKMTEQAPTTTTLASLWAFTYCRQKGPN